MQYVFFAKKVIYGVQRGLEEKPAKASVIVISIFFLIVILI